MNPAVKILKNADGIGNSTGQFQTKNEHLVVALAGNPNAGKTTLFNALTGLRQKVANYPGVTVERKEGVWRIEEKNVRLIDLPGLYSLDATSIDEQIASDILTGKVANVSVPDVVVAVVDATNLERNLYLVTQLLEFDIPVVIALTMIDSTEKRAIAIDTAKISEKIGVPVVPLTAATNRGIKELSAEIVKATAEKRERRAPFLTGEFENGKSKIFARYSFISDIVQESVGSKSEEKSDFVSFSEKIDRILTHKVFGLVILVAILLLVFQAIFSWAELPMNLLEAGFGALGDAAKAVLPEGLLADLVSDGIIAGVGGVLVFLPQILLLFLFISILEDTGYMARAAFLLDKLMSKVGLHGKAFLPLMSSFACAIPGIMATRTIENPKDRLTTILIAPFMSCSARLPVYALMIATFFAGQTVFGFVSLGAVLMLGMYLLGIITAIIVAFILKKMLLKSPPPPFVMEIPAYRLPNWRNVFQNMFNNGWMFVKRAGTVILALSIILWGLTTFPRSAPDQTAEVQTTMAETAAPSADESEKAQAEASDQLRNSYAGRIGHIIEPVIQPLGFDWKIGIALISSFAAREVLVSTLGIIYNGDKEANEESENLISAIQNEKKRDGTPVWTPLTALTLMVFFVLAMQCMSTVAVVRRETNSWKWAIFMIVYMTGLAYIAAFLTYQGGKFLGFA